MTSKEQERKALAQIKKIVDGLGEGSYIATAFEGCFEDAEYNIRDDAAYSMQSRWESAKNESLKLKDQLEHLQGVRQHLEGKLEVSEQDAKKAHDEAHEAWMKVRELEANLKAATEANEADLETASAALEGAQETIDRQADEILHLKAKLYDLMTK